MKTLECINQNSTIFATSLVCTFKIYCDANFNIFLISVVRNDCTIFSLYKHDYTPAEKVQNVPKGSKTTTHSRRTGYAVKKKKLIKTIQLLYYTRTSEARYTHTDSTLLG